MANVYKGHPFAVSMDSPLVDFVTPRVALMSDTEGAPLLGAATSGQYSRHSDEQLECLGESAVSM